jgi:hypothetical protein
MELAASAVDKKGIKFYMYLELCLLFFIAIDVATDGKHSSLKTIIFIIIFLNLILPIIQVKILMSQLKTKAQKMVSELSSSDKERLEKGKKNVMVEQALTSVPVWLMLLSLIFSLGTVWAIFEHSKQIAEGANAKGVINYLTFLG